MALTALAWAAAAGGAGGFGGGLVGNATVRALLWHDGDPDSREEAAWRGRCRRMYTEGAHGAAAGVICGGAAGAAAAESPGFAEALRSAAACVGAAPAAPAGCCGCALVTAVAQSGQGAKAMREEESRATEARHGAL
eukprot:TRINITY_DN32964_c0_g1_i2.p4 TRINITY_DN32964_c0_g1~~TRINITY_DN32964_c0_g1_i2.p4  ORF type:complete len:137 (+),score=28.25 TRINITY_DN32964_c0_g1_i2:77-487(+)